MTAQDGFSIPALALCWSASSPCGIGFSIAGFSLGVAAPVAPTITIVSPTPGVTPGQAGGLPADWATARVTPIVIDIDGSGLLYASVVARYPINDDDVIERVVYRRGSFRAGFAPGVAEQVTATKLRLHILPIEGWPNLRAITDLELDVDAIGGGALSVVGASS